MACRESVLLDIARHLGPAQADMALTLLLRLFDRRMTQAQSPYVDELALVREIGGRTTTLQRAQ